MITSLYIFIFLSLAVNICASPAGSAYANHGGYRHRINHKKTPHPATTSVAQTPLATTAQPPSATPTETVATAASAAVSPSVNSSEPKSTPSIASGNPNPNFIRGVNIGGWLLIDKTFNTNLFTGLLGKALDQWTFDSILGADTALESHYQNYFNESHVELLKSYGINTLRIPIGFWAYDASGTPYYSLGIGKGADAYLEKAVGWAKAAGLKVWIDCHGSPGSQNGFATSGHAGPVEWQTDANQAKSIAILEKMAQKYGAAEYKGTVIGLQIVNEPVSSGSNTFEKNQEFAKNAYTAVKAKAANKDMAIVMHDAFKGPGNWTTLGQSLGPKGSFVIDTHMYQTKTEQDQVLTQQEHIQKVCEQAIAFGDVNQKVPVVVGEWTATTQICVNPDGTTIPGTQCSVEGCACVTDPVNKWTDKLIDQMRRYVEAHLEVFDAYTSGYFLWSWTDPSHEMGSWSIKTGIEKGFLPKPLNDVTKRKYMGQCDA